MLVRFFENCRGGVAPLVAITALPLMAAVGGAIDYTRASAARTAFQNALDATALMLSRSAATQSAADLQTTATNTFNALFTQADASNVAVSATYASNSGSKVVLTGTATIKTDFLSILGINQININASATSTWGNTRLRVALVLDNTGSMSSSGKITALKTAAKGLLTQLSAAATSPDDVYVSIIPFSKDVNLNPANYSQSWLRWDLWEAANGTCSSTRYTSQKSCLSAGKTWTPAAHSTWNGCVTDRDQNFDTTNDAPVAGSTLYPAEQYSSCPAPALGLSNDWTALSSEVDAMQPNGNTNQAIGLQLGWQSLTASPFSIPPEDPNYQYNDVIILLTDGLNTEDRWYTNISSINTRQQITCDNIKAANITLYTVQVNTGGDPTSTLLQNCASDPGKFFLLTSASQMITTFSQIGTALSNLRLSM
ncbi:MAG TPA: pilus assembly protein [Pseudolabrys sp.]|jgi:Flp pilus assembly protein TadG|nr:pilus assembly protein [Pseudolabrys sp.]